MVALYRIRVDHGLRAVTGCPANRADGPPASNDAHLRHREAIGMSMTVTRTGPMVHIFQPWLTHRTLTYYVSPKRLLTQVTEVFLRTPLVVWAVMLSAVSVALRRVAIFKLPDIGGLVNPFAATPVGES